MKRAVLAAIAVGALLSGPAFAADLRAPVKAPPPAPLAVFSWTGCYIGAQGGWGFGSSKGNPTNAAGANPLPFNIDIDGGIAGGHVGCQWQSGAWVIGLEGDGEWSDLKGSQSNTQFLLLFRDTTQVQGMGSVRGRLGWAADRWLFYVTGGWAIAGVETTYEQVGFPPFHTEDRTRNGWTVGGGIQWAFAPNWSARAEYRYTDLGKKSFVDPVGDVADTNKVTFSAVRVGVSYHFGAAAPISARY